MGKLTATKIKNLGEAGRYSDGDGLFLDLTGPGRGSWMLRVQMGGKRRDISLGPLKAVSLADARNAAFEMRRKVAQGIDPVAERKRERLIIPTFREAAKSVHEEQGRLEEREAPEPVARDLGDLRLSELRRSTG